jgi:PKD repeat protein
VVVAPSHTCEAHFSWTLDSANLQPNTYDFLDASLGNPTSWKWEISDGAKYYTKDITHRFQSPGIYEVCLKIFREHQGVITCTDSICEEVTTATYYSLGGHLFAGIKPINNPVSTGDTGIVCLYREVNSELIPVDTVEFTHLGYFAFPALLKGKYVARARLTSGSASFNNFLPTYFPEKLQWTDSCGFHLSDTSRYSAHVHMLSLPDIATGPCSLAGIVVQTWNFPQPPELPMADILIFSSEMIPLRFTTSKTDGTFLISEIPFGFYYLRVEVPGYHSRTTAVWLDKSTTQIQDLLLEVFDHDVTGIGPVRGSELFSCSLFPNPSHGKVFLDIDSFMPGTLLVESYSSTGAKVDAFSLSCSTGRNRIVFPDRFSGKGVFFIRILTDDRQFSTVLKMIRF